MEVKIMNKKLIYQDSFSNKFWRNEANGKSFGVIFGKIDINGQNQTKEFSSKEQYIKEAENLINEKLKKG